MHKMVVILVAVVVVISSGLVFLTVPEEIGNAMGGVITIEGGQPNLTHYSIIIDIVYSSGANLLQGNIYGNASFFSVFVMTLFQLEEWANDTNLSFSVQQMLRPWNGNIVNNVYLSSESNISFPYYLCRVAGSGQLSISYDVKPYNQYVIAFVANNGVDKYEPQLNWYHQYLQI